MHKDLNKDVFQGTLYLRKGFWSLIPEGKYTYIDGKKLFERYFESVERRIREITIKYSAAYWMHVSRRVLPNSPGDDTSPETILSVRTVLNSAIQKYGQSNFCSHVGKSKEVKISQVFNGLLLSDEFEIERQLIDQSPSQLVLTDFTQINLIEYYELEKLCYEIWFCLAKMRALQKGAIIEVDLSFEGFVKEYRTDEVAYLISSYDQRSGGFLSSATGTVFTGDVIDSKSEVFIPVLNLKHSKISDFNKVYEELFNFSVGKDYVPNFLLLPFSLGKYMKAHLPFTNDFKLKYNVSFQSLLLIMLALCYRYFHISAMKESPRVVHIMQRGYEGPELMSNILRIVKEYKAIALRFLGIDYEIKNSEIKRAIQFLTLKDRSVISLMYSGTLRMFVPAGEDRFYIDYSILFDILNNLFFDIDLNKHNFRGLTLEEVLNEQPSYLPTKPCKNIKGQEKQIDFSVRIAKLLIIGECKVVAKSLGFYTGDIKSLQYRRERVIDRGLSEVDAKAQWLAANPVGRNYNLDDIEYILPIAISSFKEYIPSTNSYYWITRDVPRVLTVTEVRELVKLNSTDKLLNLVPVIGG